jgi:RNA polymerase sigma-70 factor (sigma-E family)
MRARDEREFVEFATATAARLFRGAYALCGDRQTAEDAVQAALTSACVSWRRVQRADSPEAYVRRMVINQLLGWRRRKSWRLESLRDSVPDAGRESHEDKVADTDLMWRALAGLPAQQRAVMVLRYYEDLSEAEIAEVLGIRPGTVKSQASAAMAHLRRDLDTETSARGKEAR